MEVQGQIDTIRLEQGIPPPPPPPPPQGNDTMAFKMVEEMPRFPGCENLPTIEEKKECSDRKLLEFFQKNIVYPAEAKAKRVMGTVIVSWIIERDGQITSPAIVKDIGSGCGEEALRIVNLMKEKRIKWTPGPARGRPIRILYNFPVKFTEEMLGKL